MSRNGGEPREARRYDVHAIVAGAVFTAFVAGMQMRVVQNVQRDGFQGGKALSDEGDAIGVFGHGGNMKVPTRRQWRARQLLSRLANQGLPGGLPELAFSSVWMCLPSHTDWPITNTTIKPIRPKALKLTHCDSVK